MQDFEHSTVMVNNSEFHYMKFGSGKRNLIIIPGLYIKNILLSSGLVAEAFEAFTDTFTVYVYERRKQVPDNYTIKNLTDDLADCMKALGIQKADIFGASLGGLIAQSLAINYPQLVNSVNIASTTYKTSAENEAFVDKLIELAQKENKLELVKFFSEKVYSKAFILSHESVLTSLSQTITEEEVCHFIRIAKCIKNINFEKDLPNIKCPVFTFSAEGDQIFGAEPGIKIAELTKGTSYVYKDSSHALYDEEADFRERLFNCLK
ncbi:MAG: alpha/beta hydrolase [Treponema sp.]|nr:alpha/beta hydrolase [Treponema sp.]